MDGSNLDGEPVRLRFRRGFSAIQHVMNFFQIRILRVLHHDTQVISLSRLSSNLALTKRTLSQQDRGIRFLRLNLERMDVRPAHSCIYIINISVALLLQTELFAPHHPRGYFKSAQNLLWLVINDRFALHLINGFFVLFNSRLLLL